MSCCCVNTFSLSLSLSLPFLLLFLSPSIALPEIILSTPDPLVTSTGANVSLDCFADGSPLQNVTWIFTNISGVRLFEIQFVVDNDTARTGYTKYTPLVSDINEAYISERFSISDNTIPSERVYGRLNINNINVYDAGNYTCTLTNVYNLMDPDTYTVGVKVQCKYWIIID